MSDIYTEFQGIASDLLTEFTQGAVVLVVPGAETPATDPWDPPTTAAATEITLAATVQDVDVEMIDNNLIFHGDKIVTVAGDVSVIPDPAHTMKVDGVDYTIFDVDQIPAAGTPVAIKVYVRR